MYRILKPGGRIQISDIVISKGEEELDESKENPRLWAECIVGAVSENNYVESLRDIGFNDVTVKCQQDYFSHSEFEATRNVAKYFKAQSITIYGIKQ